MTNTIAVDETAREENVMRKTVTTEKEKELLRARQTRCESGKFACNK